MLYYVKTGEFVDINIKYAEVASLLQLRNRIAVSKEVVDCDCSELKPCRVYRKIQELPQSHFLRMQLDGIESEYLSNSKYHRAVVVERTDSMIGVKFVEDVPSGEYFALFSKRNKHITDGTVDRIDGKIVYIRLREYFVEEDVIYVCSDRCEIFYKYMRWSLINLAFPKYFQSQSPGALAGMHLPTENSEEPLTADCSVNSEGCSIFSGDDILKIERDCKDLSENDFLDEEFSSCRGIDREISFSGESLIKDFQSEENDHLEGTEVDSSMIDEISNLSSIELSSIEAPIGDNFKSSQISSVNINSKLMNSSSLEVRPKRQKVAFNHEDVPFLANASTDSLPFTASEESIKTQVSIPSLYKDEFGRLNEGQQAALIKALNCKYFNTVHGMPGTGKTTLISLLIKILAYYGKKILVICYTHMAIENIIKKIGSTPYYRANWPINEKEKFKESVASAKVVFGTCFCFGDPVFIQNKFNFCIIDEGSQMHLLLALIPISLSERVCVVGDHLQLKPLAKSNKEMGISIFNHLMEGCSVLRKQYRMNSGIMRLSNILFYNQQLVNGRNLKAVSNKPAVEFVDTDCTKLKDAVTALRPCTILCYFNSTVKEVKRMTNYVVTTIDRFQGSEDDRIAVVFDPVTPCCVMESRERLNVALTRARDYLCLIGSRSRMEEIEVLKELLNIL
ncbi:DNA replication ATP-dependent helicase/nuclease Dna2 [Pancytospora epiphaga]|nr:DNA replication ATP-dependent helicase/nuclease Dna2 [Pancytospora epiphaga]